jgi:hypothetical protein
MVVMMILVMVTMMVVMKLLHGHDGGIYLILLSWI